jgi:flagellar biosynthesis protein FlhF
MKIIRHTARDMRQALRGVREQLGEDAVILSSRRTGEGVEITAAVDFDASTLEAGGFANSPTPPPGIIDAVVTEVPAAPAFAARGASNTTPASAGRGGPTTALSPVGRGAAAATVRANSAPGTDGRAALANNPTVLALTTRRGAKSNKATPASAPAAASTVPASMAPAAATPAPSFRQVAAASAAAAGAATNRAPAYDPEAAYDPASARESARPYDPARQYESARRYEVAEAEEPAQSDEPAPSYDELASFEGLPAYNPAGYDADFISEAARQAVAEYAAAPKAPVLAAASAADDPHYTDPVEEIREATLTPLASNEVKATFAQFQAPAAPSPAATEAMGNELKTLRRMLETQLAHLAWNDLTRRAPVHTEILRELTEIGITQDLAEHLVRQLPEDTELTFARRFTIAGLSQYLKVTGDHWLDDGGRVAFAGATGVGKTTTLAKIAVRWVLRHGPRDIALIAADSVRIGAQDQLQSLAQLLGVPVYTPEKFENLPSLLSNMSERLILIDTPGSSVRDPQLAGRLAVLSNSASKLQTALVLAASTQAGAIEEAVKHFAPANPSCCVLTKLDEAASLGGVLSVLVRARLPVSYMSEGQRVPEDLRPARALELVSAAVRLAKASGAAADEDLLRRRFGKTAHGIS